jgi:hypothetical protein
VDAGRRVIADACFIRQVAFNLSYTTNALRENRGIALLTSALEEGEWSASRPVAPYPGKHPVPIIGEAGWASEPV